VSLEDKMQLVEMLEHPDDSPSAMDESPSETRRSPSRSPKGGRRKGSQWKKSFSELDVLCDADFFFWLNSQPSWLFRVFNPGKHCFEFQLN
jgi:hypothetical protein